MPAGVLSEAYARLHRSGPEWGEDQLTNHGPMAVEVMIRRGYAERVDRWVDQYRRRLDDLPGSTDPIGDGDWPEALGDGRRVADWTAYFGRQLAEAPWRDVLATWWPRLLPGVLAGTTHGVIRVGHAVRALLAGAENPETLDELAHGLAFWAARYQALPAAAHPAGRLDAGTALDVLGRIPVQNGRVAERLGQLAALPDWPGAVAALRPAGGPDQVPARLADLVTAATVRYLAQGHASPVLLVHTATAPNAVLHTLPALPRDLWVPSLSAMWTTTAAITAAYAPPVGPPTPRVAGVPEGPDAAAEVVDRAIAHGDEHVIKFTDTAAEVYTRTGNRDALAAALHITTLIAPAN
ncbi:questin oxidase family protein [Micromonospora sp. URMC 103]|uniref:questin oxidase family protein n=1 Tax=Micromonospora sp. URMC 103 TaxID=3423406 RepID=UPI003F1C21C4